METAIRTAQATDVSAVREIVASAYEPWATALGFRPLPMDDDYAALIEAGCVFVAGQEGVDGVIVLVDEGDCLLVENVAVRPELQGRGIGQALLAFAEEEAARHGLSALRLYTHEKMASNVALYLKLGYVETGREPVSVGSRVHLRKVIPPQA